MLAQAHRQGKARGKRLSCEVPETTEKKIRLRRFFG